MKCTGKMMCTVEPYQRFGRTMHVLAAWIVGISLLVSAQAQDSTSVVPEFNTTTGTSTTTAPPSCNLTDSCTLGYYCGQLDGDDGDDEFLETGFCYSCGSVCRIAGMLHFPQRTITNETCTDYCAGGEYVPTVAPNTTASIEIWDGTYHDPEDDNTTFQIIVPLFAFLLFFSFTCCAIYRKRDCGELLQDLFYECCFWCPRQRVASDEPPRTLEEIREVYEQRRLHDLLGVPRPGRDNRSENTDSSDSDESDVDDALEANENDAAVEIVLADIADALHASREAGAGRWAPAGAAEYSETDEEEAEETNRHWLAVASDEATAHRVSSDEVTRPAQNTSPDRSVPMIHLEDTSTYSLELDHGVTGLNTSTV